MSQILNQVRSALYSAIKEKRQRKVSALRFFLSKIKNEEIAQRRPLNDEEIILLLRKQVKNNQESIEAFQKGNRSDLVEKEKEEKAVLEEFLPAQLGDEEVRKVASEIIGTGVKDFGQVMGQMMGKLKGQADGATVARIVKEELDL